MNEQKVLELIRQEMLRNYNSGSPLIPPHTHNGIDNLPISGLTGGINGIQIFTASGTFSVPAGFTKFWVRIIGGGRGGGFAATSASAGTAGTSGDYVEKLATVTASSVSVTIGAGGAGAISAGSGAVGGDTSFSTYAVAKGGGSSTTSVGDLIITSMKSAMPSLILSAVGASTNVSVVSEAGGCNPMGEGGQGVTGAAGGQTDGNNGQGYGTGGSGGASGTAGSTANGGNGKDGLAIIIW